MKRHEALIPLSHDHKSTLFLAGQLKFNVADYAGYPKDIEGKAAFLLSEFESHIKKHFKKEEEILFPAASLKSHQLQYLTDELKKEHLILKQLINKVTLQPTAELLNEIGELLQQHIRKEERQLFELIQQTHYENELMALGALLKNN